jgi:hypothetical protein
MSTIHNVIAVLFLLIIPGLAMAGLKDITGIWGGNHAHLELTQTGGTIEFDCARGTISQKIITNRSGRFVANGTYAPERGGPVRQNAPANDVPVSFIGQIKGQSMTLTIRRRDTKELIGVFALRAGQEGKLVKCK